MKGMASFTIGLTKVVLLTVLVTMPGQALSRKAHTLHHEGWATPIKTGNEQTTTLQFYFHDTPSGKSPSAVMVAKPADMSHSKVGFGVLMMADDPLTLGPDPKSKMVGRAQGLYGSACQDEIGLLMVLSYNFCDGVYNGSTISILGRNSAMNPVREMPVVGGTGVFRMARGYAVAHAHSLDMSTGNAIVGYNVTVVH